MASASEFGWWIESTDEEIYGPVTKAVLQRFLTDGVVSTNTAVRHCTQATFTPVADLGLADGLELPSTRVTGDTLGEVWPKKTKDRMALAESGIECAYHRRPAVLSCVRCQAPFCSKCRMNKKLSTHFMCKKCHKSRYNRRVGAYILDTMLLVSLPTYALALPIIFTVGPETGGTIANVIGFFGTATLFARDPLFGGAGPGKRMLGLQVVKDADKTSKITYGQAFLRSFPYLIPFFNLVDGNAAYADPLQRRYGDRWAKTSVIDSDSKLEKARTKVLDLLAKKGVEFHPDEVLTVPQKSDQIGLQPE